MLNYNEHKQDSIDIKYNGFYPSENTKDFIYKVLEEIKIESPQNSRVVSYISRKNKLFKMTVEVHSFAGPFFVSSTHESLKVVSDKVLFLMRKRLVKWKSKRQQRLSIKELFYRFNYT